MTYKTHHFLTIISQLNARAHYQYAITHNLTPTAPEPDLSRYPAELVAEVENYQHAQRVIQELRQLDSEIAKALAPPLPAEHALSRARAQLATAQRRHATASRRNHGATAKRLAELTKRVRKLEQLAPETPTDTTQLEQLRDLLRADLDALTASFKFPDIHPKRVRRPTRATPPTAEQNAHILAHWVYCPQLRQPVRRSTKRTATSTNITVKGNRIPMGYVTELTKQNNLIYDLATDTIKFSSGSE